MIHTPQSDNLERRFNILCGMLREGFDASLVIAAAQDEQLFIFDNGEWRELFAELLIRNPSLLNRVTRIVLSAHAFIGQNHGTDTGDAPDDEACI
tara:strand:- start:687 stop:971 length:285 start_codon:yes stop_codon:yes gene_type:complete